MQGGILTIRAPNIEESVIWSFWLYNTLTMSKIESNKCIIESKSMRF